MIIKKFIEFIDESYLSGSRQPLYHITYRLQAILVTDLLKCGRSSRASQGNEKSISLTRNIDFTHGDDDIIELDNDKLIKYGIKSYPIDEWAWKDGKRITNINKYNFSKSNFKEVKSGRRGTKHNLNLPKEPILETEFEERIYQDIPNLGKYLISLNFKGELNIDQNRIVSDYLKKYPHIKVYLMDRNNRRKRTDITSRFIQTDVTVKNTII